MIGETTNFIHKYVLVHIKEQKIYITNTYVSAEATPKAVKNMMEVEGIGLHHVKSHLQVILSNLFHMNLNLSLSFFVIYLTLKYYLSRSLDLEDVTYGMKRINIINVCSAPLP